MNYFNQMYYEHSKIEKVVSDAKKLQEARKKIEKLSGKKIYLELFVAVKKGWTKNKTGLKEMGYDID